MKTKEILMFCALALLAMACGDDDEKEGNNGRNGNSSGDSSFKPQELVVKGNVEKGPFISGSTITMQPLNQKMQATGSSYSATITDDYGSFTFNPEKFEEPYARLSVSGYFYNEYKGDLSKGLITLQSVVELKDKSSVNVNLLTHLKYQRVMNLIEDGKDFAAANKQAQEELLKCFSLQSLNTNDVSQFSITAGTDESAALIVTSVLLLGKRSEAEFTEYLAKLCADFAEDGEFNENHRKQMQEERMAIYNKLDTISRNLVKRYQELGRQIEVKPLKNYVDWNNDGILGNESHDPSKPITLSKTEIQAPMEGGTYEVTFTSDVPLYLEPQLEDAYPNSASDESVYSGPMTGGYMTTEKSLKDNTLTITVKEAEWQNSSNAVIYLYDYMGNEVAKIKISQAGNPEGKWLNDKGRYLFNMIGEFLMARYARYDFRELYRAAQYGLSNNDISIYHLDDVMKTYALLSGTWGAQTRSSYYNRYYWDGFISLDQAIADLQKAIENLEERSAGDCRTPDDLAKSSKDVARYVLAYCYMCKDERQQAQQLVEKILNDGRCNRNMPVLGINGQSVVDYSDVVRLIN